ncbi:MAG: DUF1003 domain-containing protein [Tissierellia bacterium]|nr:DUF1003 domain-containing protein [Tissierellia bacterium]
MLGKPFDPYPFYFTKSRLPCTAVIQASILMVSQNRQEYKDRIRCGNDYIVNLKVKTLAEDFYKV